MTKERFTELTGLKPTDEEFEVINGLCTVLTELSRAFLEEREKLGKKDYKPIFEDRFCRMYGKGDDDKFFLIVELVRMHLMALSPHRSDDSFESLKREISVVRRMLARDYKLSLDDRRILLEKVKAATQEYNEK